MTAKPSIIPTIYFRHLEEFTFLWRQRDEALHSTEFYLSDLAKLEQRIEAHLDGLLVPRQTAVPLLEKCLEGEEASLLFAAVYVLLRFELPEAGKIVIDKFLSASPETVASFRQALAHGPITAIEQAIREAATSAAPHIAAAATEVLLFHRRAEAAVDRLSEFLNHDAPEVRRTGWRILALRG